jgi:hypothetical protein
VTTLGGHIATQRSDVADPIERVAAYGRFVIAPF